MSEPMFLLMKRGLYYGPNNCGYTGIKENAGRYPKSYVDVVVSHSNEVSAIPEASAPDYAPNCFDDIKAHHLSGKLAASKARVKELEALNIDMLEALKVALKDADWCLEEGDQLPPWVDAVRAAIAKAEAR